MPSRRQVLASAGVIPGALAGCQSILPRSNTSCDPPSVSVDPGDWAAPAHDLANSGVSPESSFPDQSYSQQWALRGYENPETKSINAVFQDAGQPLLVGNRAFFTVRKRYETESPDIRLYALQLSDGSEDWHVDLWRSSGLFVAGELLYYQAYSMGEGEQVVARSANTGEKTWSTPVEDELPVNPTLAGNRILYGERTGDATSRIQAVHPETGASCWKSELDGLAYTGAVGEQFVFYGVYRGNDTPDSVVALDPTTGDKEWTTRLEAGNGRVVAVRGDLVHVCSHERCGAIETSTGEFQWQKQLSIRSPDIGAVTDSTLLLRGRLREQAEAPMDCIIAYDRDDGTIKWQTDDDLDANFVTPPTVCGNRLYFVASTTPRSPSTFLTYGLESGSHQASRELPAGSVKQPVIVRNRVLIMTLRGLLLFS